MERVSVATTLSNGSKTHMGGHLKPVTLKPVIRIFPRFRFHIFRDFALRNLLLPLFFRGEREFSHFPHFPCIGFELLILKIRPTGFIMTGLK